MTDEVLRASIKIDVKDAIAAYTSARQAHVSMVTALNTGAGALFTTGAAVTAVGVGIAAGFVVAVNAASEFERKLDFFGAVADATVGEMEKIRTKALELGADSIYSADEVADSFTTLAKAGVDAKDVLAGVGEAVINLGAAADIPLADAASGLTTILNTFNIKAEDSVAVVDKLAGAANSSNIEVQDLILTMTYAGASAAVAGVSFEDMNTAIAVLGEAGIKGSKAGTGLRQMIDKLVAPTNAGKEALEGLGVITEEMGNQLLTAEGKMKGLPEVLDILNSATSNLNAAEKIDVLGKIFPITSLPTILTLLQGGSDAMAELNEEINKASAADIAAKRLDNLSGDVEYLRGELQTLVINIGATQQALARGLVQAIEKVVMWLNQLSPSALGALILFAQISAVALILFGVIMILAGGMLRLLSLFLVMRDVLLIFPKLLPAIAGGFRVLWAAILGPIGVIIGVITAIVAVLIWFFATTEEGKKVWAEIQQVFADVFKQLQPAFDSLSTALGNLMPALAGVAATISGALLEGLIAMSPMIVFIAEVIANVLSAALTIVVPLLTGLADLLNGPLGTGITIVIGIITAIIVVIKLWSAAQWLLNIALTANPIGAIIMAVVALVAAIIWVATQTTFFQDLWTNVSSFFITVWTEVARFFTELWTNLVTFFMGIWNSIVAFFTPILTVIYNVIKFYIEMWINIFLIFAAVLVTIWQAIVTAVTWAWELIWGFIGPIIDNIVAVITLGIQAIQETWDFIWNYISSIFMTIWNNILNFLIPIVVNIMSFITSAVQTVQGVWNSVWGAISSFFISIWQNFVGAVQGPVNTIFGIIGSIQGTIMGLFSGVGNWLYNTGKQIIEGLINGISSMFKRITDAISNVVNGAIDWAKSVLGIASPSKVFRAIGVNTILGMIMGVKATQPALERTMDIVGTSVDDFYNQVYAAREMSVMLNLESQMGVSAYSAAQASQLGLLNEKLGELMEKDTINIEKIENNYPEPEPSSDSLPNNVRKAAYLVG